MILMFFGLLSTLPEAAVVNAWLWAGKVTECGYFQKAAIMPTLPNPSSDGVATPLDAE
jgi:hypothetical protein